MNYLQLKQQLRNLGGIPLGGEYQTLVEVSLNAVYRRLLSLVKAEHEDREFSLTTRADVGTYGMPLYVKQVERIEDGTNDKNIYTITKRKYQDRYPGDTTTGTPDLAQPFGTFGVQRQPAANGVITLVSDNAGDAGSNYIVVLTGFDSSGNLIREEVTMNGTTSVDSTSSFTTLQRPVKVPATGYAFSGAVTLSDASANTLGVIPTWWESPDYFWVEFYPIPSAALTYTITAQMRQPPLVEDEDWPEIDQDFHDLIWRGTLVDLGPKIGMASFADRVAITFENRLDEFLEAHGEQPNTQEYMTFSNVWNVSGPRQRPYPPRVPGVDTPV